MNSQYCMCKNHAVTLLRKSREQDEYKYQMNNNIAKLISNYEN